MISYFVGGVFPCCYDVLFIGIKKAAQCAAFFIKQYFGKMLDK